MVDKHVCGIGKVTNDVSAHPQKIIDKDFVRWQQIELKEKVRGGAAQRQYF